MTYTCDACQKYWTDIYSFDAHNRKQHSVIVKLKCPAQDCLSRTRDPANFFSHIMSFTKSEDPQMAQNHKRIADQWSTIFDKDNGYQLKRLKKKNAEHIKREREKLVHECQETMEQAEAASKRHCKKGSPSLEQSFPPFDSLNLDQLRSVGDIDLTHEELRAATSNQQPSASVCFSNLTIDLNVEEPISELNPPVIPQSIPKRFLRLFPGDSSSDLSSESSSDF